MLDPVLAEPVAGYGLLDRWLFLTHSMALFGAGSMVVGVLIPAGVAAGSGLLS
jgi:hypothetical protein